MTAGESESTSAARRTPEASTSARRSSARAVAHALSPRRWTLWTLPTRVIVLILAVDTLAVVLGVTVAASTPVAPGEATTWLILAAGVVVHLEAARRIERIRHTDSAAGGAPYVDAKGMWSFAGLLLLSPGPALVLVVFTVVWWWLRVSRRPLPHRWVYSGAAILIGSCASLAVLHLPGGDPLVRLTEGPTGLVLVALAAIVRWVVNHGLVVTAISVSSPSAPWAQRLGSATDNLIGLGTLALGVALAVLVETTPWLVPVLLLPVLCLHRGFLLQTFARAARTDIKTGLANAPHWRELAVREMARAKRRQVGLGVLMIDLDEFKTINDQHGHLVGDVVLRAVADTLRDEVRAYDAVGRFGGEEFVVLLAEVAPDDVVRTAERVRLRISECAVPVSPDHEQRVVRGLTASVGAATYPMVADDLPTLLVAADTALYAAKRAGRNRVEVATVPG